MEQVFSIFKLIAKNKSVSNTAGTFLSSISNTLVNTLLK